MALVHARIRRVIFGTHNYFDGGLGGGSKLDRNNDGVSSISIHSLPGTNHHFRAFRLKDTCDKNEVYHDCLQLHHDQF